MVAAKLKEDRVKKGVRSMIVLFAMAALWGGPGLLCGCGAGGPDRPSAAVFAVDPAEQAQWTVLFYLCGTNLESGNGAATDNLLELLRLEPGGHYNFVVQTGGAAEWQNGAVDPRYLERWMLKERKLLLVDQLPSANMGGASALGDFLAWGVENFPAEKYAVVLWDHGGGALKGVIYDELYGYDSLNINELAEGLARAGVIFELIGFDACLMATLETAAAVAPYGRYMVASQEYEPAHGWDYAKWPAYLEAAGTGLEIGRAICDSYYEKCAAHGNEAMATLAVVDLARVASLTKSFDGMAGEMTGVTGDINLLREFTQGAARTEHYGGNNESEGYANLVDLGDLTVNTVSVLPQTAVHLLEDLFDAVQYEVHGKSRGMANGLSVYYPLRIGYRELFRYAEVSVSSRYVSFLGALTGRPVPGWVERQAPEADTLEENDYTVELEAFVNSEGYFELRVTAGLASVRSVRFRLYYVDEEYEEYVLMGYDNDIDFSYAGEGIFLDNFRGVWPTLNGHYCAPQLIAEEAGYNLYSVPILLNGEEMSLRAAWVWDGQDQGHFEIYGALSGVDDLTGMSSRDIVQVQEGDEVELLFDAEDWYSGEIAAYGRGGFTVKGGVLMEESGLLDGDYLYQFAVTDVFGREYCSDAVMMQVQDGRINFYETD